MMEPMNQVIPDNHSGIQTNTESTIVSKSEKEAMELFREIKDRLLDVNRWHELAGPGSAAFLLTDSHGNEVHRNPVKGDHFKIRIPAPKSRTGEGSDWVQVEDIQESHSPGYDMTAIVVRPATNPTNEQNDVAHFFSDEATSSFIVRREGKNIIAGVYGRNEKPNTGSDNLADKIRNTAVAAGAISGFSKLQW